jgi:tetratricopeptide (TPR) repeat protein
LIQSVLASASSGLGKYAKAESLRAQLLEHYLRDFDEDNPKVLGARLNLGVTLERETKYDEAAKILEPAIAPSTRVLGKTNPTTVKLLNTLGLAPTKSFCPSRRNIASFTRGNGGALRTTKPRHYHDTEQLRWLPPTTEEIRGIMCLAPKSLGISHGYANPQSSIDA